MLKVIYRPLPAFGEPTEDTRKHSCICERISDMAFPSGGHVSVISEEGRCITHGFLCKKDFEYDRYDEYVWTFTPKMFQTVEDFLNTDMFKPH